jgi:hypothetical protein
MTIPSSAAQTTCRALNPDWSTGRLNLTWATTDTWLRIVKRTTRPI